MVQPTANAKFSKVRLASMPTLLSGPRIHVESDCLSSSLDREHNSFNRRERHRSFADLLPFNELDRPLGTCRGGENYATKVGEVPCLVAIRKRTSCGDKSPHCPSSASTLCGAMTLMVFCRRQPRSSQMPSMLTW